MPSNRLSSVVRSGSENRALEDAQSYEDFADGINNDRETRSSERTPPAREREDAKEDPEESWVEWIENNEVKWWLGLTLFAIVGSIAIKFVMDTAGLDLFGKSTGKSAPPAQKVPSAIVSFDGKGEIQWQNHLADGLGKFKLFNDDQVKYKEGKKLFLLVAGHVFDVTKGGKTYQKGSGYHGFIGRDATRAFVTGQFDEAGLVPDVDGLGPDDMLGISKWINFYLNADKYVFLGLHIGTFFDDEGKPTPKMIKFQEDVQNAQVVKYEEEEKEKIFPTCNMDWNAQSGSRLWCTEKSGGIQRDWTGLPRILNEPGKGPRCACVRNELLSDPRLEIYKGCAPDSVECFTKE